jgi:hypothetical protein
MTTTQIQKVKLSINENDLVAMGITSTTVIIEVLGKLNQVVLDDPSVNTRERLIELVSYSM